MNQKTPAERSGVRRVIRSATALALLVGAMDTLKTNIRALLHRDTTTPRSVSSTR
jgi:hypothetical protein